MSKKFTQKVFDSIIDNSKENPFDISNYNRESVFEFFTTTNNKLVVSFYCEDCEKYSIKILSKQHLRRTTYNTIIYCHGCNLKKNNFQKYGVISTTSLEEVQDKTKKTNLKKYGCERPQQNVEVKNKTKRTNLERYGHENVLQNKEIREKGKKTCLQKYGVDNYSKTDECKDKVIQTNIERYGEDYIDKRLEKSKQTNLERFGCENVFQNEEIKSKIKQTNTNNLGVEYPMQSDIVQEKSIQTKLDTYGSIHIEYKYLYDRIYFDSSWELAFYIYHKDKGHKIIKEPCTFEYTYNNKTHYYFPDFKVGSTYYEIKGSQFLTFYKNGKIKGMKCPFDESKNELYNSKYKCMKKHNVHIIYDKQIDKYLKYINNNYKTIEYLEKFKLNKKEGE